MVNPVWFQWTTTETRIGWGWDMQIVGRRFGSLVLTMAIVLATAAAALVPTVALADTSYTTCPLFSQFKSDVEAISGTGTVTFLAPYCNMTANSTITVQSDANVTIKGDGLTLTGGTPSARGAFALFSVGVNASLSVDYATLAYAQYAITPVLFATPANVAVANSTITGTEIAGVASSSPVTVSNSTIFDNKQNGATSSISLTVTNSTVTGNGTNGLISNQVIVTSSTITDNDVGVVSFGALSLTCVNPGRKHDLRLQQVRDRSRLQPGVR